MNGLEGWFRDNGVMAASLLFSLVAVFLGFLFIYTYAVWDFRPKYLFPRGRRGEVWVSPEGEAGTGLGFEPVERRRELTQRELGIAEFGDKAMLSPEEQRRLKMHEHVHGYVRMNPEEATNVIKSWLGS